MYITEKILCLALGYVFGCFLTAEIVAKINKVDVRYIDKSCPGRGNPGMANVMLNLGFKQGVLVFIGDSVKTIVSMLLAYYVFKDFKYAAIYAGFGTIIGHNYPFWRKFNGGKGVLVTVMWFLFMMPKHCWICFAVSALIVMISGNLNVAAVVFPLIAIPFVNAIYETDILVLVIISAVIMIIRNRHDLLDTIQGKYQRVHLFKSKK